MEKSCGGDRSAGFCKRTRGRGNLSPKPAQSEWRIADPSIRHVLKNRPVKSGHRIQRSPRRVNRDSLRDSLAAWLLDATAALQAMSLKWTKRIGLGILALAVCVPAVGLLFEQWSRRTAARNFLPPGELIEFDGARAHLNCAGRGRPTIVLEAGGGGGSPDWVPLQSALAAVTRVCSYDRAGHLWSERRDGPRDAETIASELHSLLEVSSEAPPFVVVGHSIGGAFSLVFSHRHRDDVVGLVLVDPMSPDVPKRLPEILPPRFPPAAAIVLEAVARIGLLRLSFALVSDGAPERVREIRSALYPQSAGGFAGVTLALRESLRQAGEVGPFGDLPIVVLSSSDTRRSNRVNTVIQELHAQLAGLSTNSVHKTVLEAGHYIHWDRPEVVMAAIRDVLRAVNDGTPLVLSQP